MQDKPELGELYSHYRTGNEYRVICIGRHSETGEQIVVYEALYADAEFPLRQVWCRPVEMFMGDVECEGKKVKRFSKIP